MLLTGRYVTLAILSLVFPLMAGASSPLVTVNLSPALECSTSLKTLSGHGPRQLTVFLESILPRVVAGPEIAGDVGTLSEIALLLERSGTPRPAAQYIDRLINWVIYENKGQQTTLGHTVAQLEKFKNSEQSLVLAVVSKSRLIYGSAVHITPNPKFVIAPFNRPMGQSKKAGWINGDSQLIEPPRIMVISGGRNIYPVNATMGFFHEATHFADFELVSQWIDANIARLKAGGISDELFVDYFRINGNGDHQVDEGFLRIFLESRAYATESAGFVRMTPSNLFAQMQKNLRVSAMNDIRSFPVTHRLVEKLNISEQNVFELGDRWGRIMMATIKN